MELLFGVTEVALGRERKLTRLSSGEMYHILQELLVVAIVIAIYVVSVVIKYFRPAFGIIDIVVIMAVGMLFGVAIQESTKRAFRRIKGEQ
jgi:hypothetical protein